MVKFTYFFNSDFGIVLISKKLTNTGNALYVSALGTRKAAL